MQNIYRGQIYYAELLCREGSVQRGKRPVIIVSTNVGNEHSSVVTIVPITSKDKKPNPSTFEIYLPRVRGTVLCNQVQTIDKTCIGDYAGALTRHYIDCLDKALLNAFNLNKNFGDSLPPEEGRIVQQQIEKCDDLRKSYLREVNLLSRMVGYGESPISEVTQELSISLVDERVDMPRQKRKYNKRTPEEISHFIREWDDPKNSRKEVAKVFGFSSPGIAATFYRRHKEAR